MPSLSMVWWRHAKAHHDMLRMKLWYIGKVARFLFPWGLSQDIYCLIVQLKSIGDLVYASLVKKYCKCCKLQQNVHHKPHVLAQCWIWALNALFDGSCSCKWRRNDPSQDQAHPKSSPRSSLCQLETRCHVLIKSVQTRVGAPSIIKSLLEERAL